MYTLLEATRKGGRSRSEKKILAARQNVAKAREKLALTRIKTLRVPALHNIKTNGRNSNQSPQVIENKAIESF